MNPNDKYKQKFEQWNKEIEKIDNQINYLYKIKGDLLQKTAEYLSPFKINQKIKHLGCPAVVEKVTANFGHNNSFIVVIRELKNDGTPYNKVKKIYPQDINEIQAI